MLIIPFCPRPAHLCRQKRLARSLPLFPMPFVFSLPPALMRMSTLSAHPIPVRSFPPLLSFLLMHHLRGHILHFVLIRSHFRSRSSKPELADFPACSSQSMSLFIFGGVCWIFSDQTVTSPVK